jgi:hypothetical protein
LEIGDVRCDPNGVNTHLEWQRMGGDVVRWFRWTTRKESEIGVVLQLHQRFGERSRRLSDPDDERARWKIDTIRVKRSGCLIHFDPTAKEDFH